MIAICMMIPQCSGGRGGSNGVIAAGGRGGIGDGSVCGNGEAVC